MLLAVPLVLIHGALLATFRLTEHPGRTFLLLAAGFLALAAAARRLEGSSVPLGRTVLGVAVLLRALLLPLPPTLSDDLLRYVWDGKVAAAGENPYRLPPEAEELEPLRDELWQRVPHREVATVYPPLALSLFSIAARSPRPLLALKALLAAADLGTCALLLWIARRLEIPSARVVWYAWNPLVTLEVAGMGHVDALGVLAVAGTVALLLRRPPRVMGAAVTAAAGVLAKLGPLAALAMWSRQSHRPWHFLALAVGLVAVVAVPVLVATGGVPSGLVTYGVSWEFNGPIYEPLWRLLSVVNADGHAKHLVDSLKEATGHIDAWNRVYPYLYPQLLAKVVLGVGMLGAVALSLREADPIVGSGRLFGRLLLLSATLYPWYLLWVLPWAALRRHSAWLALSGLILLSYLPRVSVLVLFPGVFVLIWAPFWLLAAFGRRWSTA